MKGRSGSTAWKEIEIEYGNETHVLGPGESIYDSIVPHQVRAHNGQNAKFLACVYAVLSGEGSDGREQDH
ncbi:MAG: cupin domain-containing protein [Eggerthella lenta]